MWPHVVMGRMVELEMTVKLDTKSWGIMYTTTRQAWQMVQQVIPASGFLSIVVIIMKFGVAFLCKGAEGRKAYSGEEPQPLSFSLLL